MEPPPCFRFEPRLSVEEFVKELKIHELICESAAFLHHVIQLLLDFFQLFFHHHHVFLHFCIIGFGTNGVDLATDLLGDEP